MLSYTTKICTLSNQSVMVIFHLQASNMTVQIFTVPSLVSYYVLLFSMSITYVAVFSCSEPNASSRTWFAECHTENSPGVALSL